MRSWKKRLCVLLSVFIAFSVLLPCATAAETYPESLFWDKAGEDADNGYKAYMVEFGAPLVVPDPPERSGYVFLGWKDWNTDEIVDLAAETMNAKGRLFYAAWAVATVPFYFYVGGKLLATVNSIPGEAFVQPRYPELEGYTFAGWTPKTPAVTPDTSMSFTAVFTPNTYAATLIVDGEVYQTIEYTYGQKSIDLPDVPKKVGYTGAWEPYSLGVGGVTIHAIYKAADNTVKTIAGDADGDSVITLRDAAVMQHILAGGYDTNDTCAANMDVNGDGVMNLKDVVLVRRYLAGGWNVRLF